MLIAIFLFLETPVIIGGVAFWADVFDSAYTFRVALGKSMLPTIRTGDAVLLKRGAEDVKVGDIISFRANALNVTILHRVIRIEENQSLIFRTKGDGNNFADDIEIKTGDIVGKVVMIIPTNYCMSPFFSLSVLVLSVILLSKKFVDYRKRKITTPKKEKRLIIDHTLFLLLLITTLSLTNSATAFLFKNI